MNEDGIAKLSKLCEGLHPAADVHFILFAYFKAIDWLLGVRLRLQLKEHNTTRDGKKIKKEFFIKRKKSNSKSGQNVIYLKVSKANWLC